VGHRWRASAAPINDDHLHELELGDYLKMTNGEEFGCPVLRATSWKTTFIAIQGVQQ